MMSLNEIIESKHYSQTRRNDSIANFTDENRHSITNLVPPLSWFHYKSAATIDYKASVEA